MSPESTLMRLWLGGRSGITSGNLSWDLRLTKSLRNALTFPYFTMLSFCIFKLSLWSPSPNPQVHLPASLPFCLNFGHEVMKVVMASSITLFCWIAPITACLVCALSPTFFRFAHGFEFAVYFGCLHGIWLLDPFSSWLICFHRKSILLGL